jgi:guanylate kinase
MKQGKFLVIIGPSGVGKTSLVKALRDKGVVRPIPSWTTRPPRPKENDERIDHIFVSEEDFEQKAKARFFLEEVTLFGLPFRYGLPPIDSTSATGPIPVLLLRAPLVPLLQKHYTNYVIYQIEDSYDRVAERLQDREKQGEKQGERLTMYEKEITAGRAFADRVIANSDDFSELVAKVEGAILQDFKKDST